MDTLKIVPGDIWQEVSRSEPDCYLTVLAAPTASGFDFLPGHEQVKTRPGTYSLARIDPWTGQIPALHRIVFANAGRFKSERDGYVLCSDFANLRLRNAS